MDNEGKRIFATSLGKIYDIVLDNGIPRFNNSRSVCKFIYLSINPKPTFKRLPFLAMASHY